MAATDNKNLQSNKLAEKNSGSAALQALTSAALVLPGLLLSPPKAAENDSIELQYSHYEEGKRELFDVPNNNTPITAETFHLGSNISLTDRIRFAFDYIQDTWSGATPMTTSPLIAKGNSPIQKNSETGITTVGASPIINTGILLDHDKNPLKRDTLTGEILGIENQLVHVLSSASPETRKQSDFKLTYEWDEAAIDFGGGLSLENDYESYYGSLGGRWDINQKLTTLKLGLSYAQSEINSILDHDAAPYITKSAFADQIEFRGGSEIVHGNKEDWSSHFGITQILNKNALLDTNFAYTHSSGYMENPYKTTTIIFIDPDSISSDPDIPISGDVRPFLNSVQIRETNFP